MERKITTTFLPFTHLSQTMISTNYQQQHIPHDHESEEETEFSFWGCSSNIITTTENNCEDKEAKNLEFQYCSRLSTNPSSRTKAIEKGKIELMEKIMQDDMPKSSYELSFQHMVVDETSSISDNAQSCSNSKIQPKKLTEKKKNKCKGNKPSQILRVESMDSETFLLKMFFPTSLDWMKKPKAPRNGSKVSPRPSSSWQETMKQVGKEWRIKRFFVAGDNKCDIDEDGMSQNAGGGNSNEKKKVC